MDVSFVVRGFIGLAVAVVVVGAIAIIVAKTFGGVNKRRQKALAQLVFAVGIVAFLFFVFPKLLGV